MKGGVTIFISDKIGFKAKCIIRDKGGAVNDKKNKSPGR